MVSRRQAGRLTLATLAVLITTATHADNTQMMEQRGRQIIELSDDVIRQIRQDPLRAGRVTFEARVVQPQSAGGQRVIVLDKAIIEPTDTPANAAGNANANADDTTRAWPRASIREQSLAVPEHDDPSATTARVQALRTLIEGHGAALIELDREDARDLLAPQFEAQGAVGPLRGAYIIYW